MPDIDTTTFYRNAQRYDRITNVLSGDAPIAFYRTQVQRYGGPVLELACGSGRIAIPLAQEGVTVCGLDQSAEMLALAEAKSRQCSSEVLWIRSDMRTFSLHRQFRLILVATNSLSHVFSREDVEACFRSVQRHLAPGGRFIVDVFNPALGMLLRRPGERTPVCEYCDSDSGQIINVTSTTSYDSAAQIKHETWYFRRQDSGEEESAPLNLRMFFPKELDALLHYNGFRIEEKYGSYDRTPFNDASLKQLIVCQCAV